MWKTGDRVLAHRLPGEYWYPGIIRHIQADRFFVIYDDGEDGFVSATQVMPLELDLGALVFARTIASDDLQSALVIDKKGEELQLQFKDGALSWMPTAQVCVRRVEQSEPPALQEGMTWPVGCRVLACWFDLFWYAGCVLAVEGDQVSVVFDHGGHAMLAANRVRPLTIEEGDRVQARWKAGAEFYPGKIVRCEGEIVDIAYDDGDKETTLLRLVRAERDEWLPAADRFELDSGDRVLACWFDGLWYPGVILTIEGKRVHVLFDDNDQAHLTWDRVLPLQIEIGDHVLCRWKGGPFYFPGEVTRRHGERIFVQYEDGREEWTSVRLIRMQRQS
jgi:hypothetical protein